MASERLKLPAAPVRQVLLTKWRARFFAGFLYKKGRYNRAVHRHEGMRSGGLLTDGCWIRKRA